MPSVYKWTGRTRAGVLQGGEMTANTKEEVIAYLRRQNILPTSVKVKPGAISIKLPLGPGRPKVKDKDIVIFTRQFATMIDAGLPIVQCLDILEKQTENKALSKVLGEIKTDVEAGSTYADALRRHPKIFSDLYVNIVTAGETGGILDTVLNRLSQYIEKAMKLKKKVKGAMIYPSVIISVAVIVVAVIMVFVVPTFARMFKEMGGTLPMPTQIVINISDFLAGIGGLIIFLIIILAIVFIVQFRRTPKGRKIFDELMLKLPIFGILIRKIAVAKFTRTLGTLISSGVSIMDALDITAKTAGNKIIEEAVIKTRIAVSEGKTLSEPLSKTGAFPPMVTQMISVGESTGRLDAMLGKIADFYDDEVDNAVANLTVMLEPMLMIYLGITVGFIVIAMYLPIFKFASLVQ